jgi:hypothetical protein
MFSPLLKNRMKVKGVFIQMQGSKANRRIYQVSVAIYLYFRQYSIPKDGSYYGDRSECTEDPC